MLTQRQIDKRSGTAKTFWSNVVKRQDGVWLWTGYTNNNHNTVSCDSYDYGEFELITDETQYNSKPTRILKSKMAHHVSVFLTYGVEIPTSRKTGYDVFPANANHLDVNPDNLWVRSISTRQELRAAEFCAANDNSSEKAKVAA